MNELNTLNTAVHPKYIEPGGVSLNSDITGIIKYNNALRTASHILVRLGNFYATGFPELKRKLARLQWNLFLCSDGFADIRVSSRKSKLYHEKAIAQRIQEFLEESFQVSFQNRNDITQQIMVRVYRDQFTISLDASGELYRRGYRRALAKAPLRENLAAGLIMYSGWDQNNPLVDPFCGSGVIPIEAAMLKYKISPNRNRYFPCLNWPLFSDYNVNIYDNQKFRNADIIDICGSDRDNGAIQMARENANRANVSDFIKFDRKSISEIFPYTKTGWIVTNPPYGKRIHSNQDLRNLYIKFGNLLKERFQGWHITMLCNDPYLLNQMKMNFEKGPVLDNGGIKVRIFSGNVT